jgi:hypothetical protein
MSEKNQAYFTFIQIFLLFKQKLFQKNKWMYMTEMLR